ncbi:MAG TPA: hypothetical protein VN932_12275 [Rhizomicrobium sp.]|nr:hypothetical protein [Rhizomicrobium sp.]
MRTILLAAAFAALSLSAANADDLLATRYGNTVVVKMTSGMEVHMYYAADGTFTGKVMGMNYPLKGTWKSDGSNVCLTYDPAPPNMTNPSCTPVVAHQVGDSWTANGNTATLVQGIQ